MSENLSFGKKLSPKEYEAAVIKLQNALPPMPSEEQDKETRRKELELAIDRYLGCDFPLDRRKALWSVQEKIERRRLWLILKYYIRKLFADNTYRGIEALTGVMMKEYSKVLNESELKDFFVLKEGEKISLPIDKIPPNKM